MSPLGAHSYDPGVSPTLVVWTIPIDEDSVEVDFDAGEAVVQLKNVCSVFDVFAVPNSFDPARGLGFVGATINSLRMHWTGVSKKRSFNNGSTFRATSVENVVGTMAVTATTPPSKPPFTPSPKDGFTYTSDIKTTTTNFAQIAQVANGALF